MGVRPAGVRDRQGIWAVLEPVIRAGETYALPREMGRDAALAYWLGADRETFVAEEDGMVLGTYYLRANQLGGGGHVANCGYVTGVEGKGVGRGMAEHSFGEARARGFRAMVFNFVVGTNVRAIRLWQALGFEIVGRVPGAFVHPAAGEVEALVMWRGL